jgi:hypothetical protein
MLQRSVWSIGGLLIAGLVVPSAGWGQATKRKGAAPPRLGFAGNQYGDPRTFGLQLIYNFSES